MNFKKIILASSILLASISVAYGFSIVGSSTILPFSSYVAEIVGQQGVPTPIVEYTGTGGGFKVFCSDNGTNSPSITNASRLIKESELEECTKNGITPVGFNFGKDSIVVAYSNVNEESIDFTTKDLFLAVAANVPVDGVLVPNPYTNWNQINPSFPDRKIEIMGPPPTSGTRDAFLTLAIMPGCKEAVKDLGLEADIVKETCEAFRTDGAWIDSGENDNLLVQKLESNPTAFAVFGYYYYENNVTYLTSAHINGVEPTYETAIDGSYILTRDLFFYVKKEHVGNIIGIIEYVTEFLSEEAIGDDGYLLQSGLIINLEELRAAERAKISELTK